MKPTNLFYKAVTPVASIFLILAGIIQLRTQLWTSGAICIALAMLGFILSIRLLETAPFTPKELDTLRPFVPAGLAWAIIISLVAVSVYYVADNFKSAPTDRIADVTWVSAVLFGMILTWSRALPPNAGYILLERIKANRLELLAVFLLLILAFALRTLDISNHPYPWSGDEASIGSEAARILDEEVTNFFETGWSSQPNWSFVPTAITEVIFGKNIIALRATSVLMGTLAVLFTYLLGRELFNPAIGLMAGAFLATLPYHLHFSRIGVNNVADSLMSALVFWLIARAWKTDDPRYYYTAGALAGLCLYTYAGTKLVLILAVVILFFLVITQRGYLASHWTHLASFVGAAVISAAPQAAYFARHPDIFIGRLGQEGILFNGWMTQHAAQTGQSIAEILFEQFTRTTMVFIASAAPGNFYNSPNPYLTVLGSILFLVGMGYALAYMFETRHFILLLWFWSVVLLGGILTLNPPANTRLVMTSPAVALFMALGTHKILDYLQRFRSLPARVSTFILLVVVAIITYQNTSFYMYEYRKNVYFQDPNGEFAMEASLMARERGDIVQIFVLGSPRVFAGFPTFSFVAPNIPRADLTAEMIPTLQLPPDGKVGFFAIPEDRPLLEEISQKFPGGEGGLVFRRSKQQEILFEYYIVGP